MRVFTPRQTIGFRLRENQDFRCFNRVLDSDAANVTLAVLPLGMLAAGYIAKHSDFTEYSWKAGEASLDAFLVTTVAKTVTQRSRPHEGKTYGFWEGGNSFPSGHAAISWAMAAYSAKHFSDKKWVRWIAYPLAGLISFARVTSGHHFISDAVTGSMIGFSVGRFVVK